MMQLRTKVSVCLKVQSSTQVLLWEYYHLQSRYRYMVCSHQVILNKAEQWRKVMITWSHLKLKCVQSLLFGWIKKIWWCLYHMFPSMLCSVCVLCFNIRQLHYLLSGSYQVTSVGPPPAMIHCLFCHVFSIILNPCPFEEEEYLFLSVIFTCNMQTDLKCVLCI